MIKNKTIDKKYFFYFDQKNPLTLVREDGNFRPELKYKKHYSVSKNIAYTTITLSEIKQINHQLMFLKDII